jgi:spoIIIJ-associated protein
MSTEATGRTIDEAVELALRQSGLSRDEAVIEVLQEPKPALLGFGGKEAHVRVTRRQTRTESAGEFVTEALGLMGYEVTARVDEAPEGLSVTLEGRDVSRIVGRHGRTLDAIEVLLAQHVNRSQGDRVHVTVDAAGYRAKREKAIEEQARQAADRAIAENAAVALDPMDPRDRRTVHLALREDPRVATTSEGEGDHRHVVITPAGAGRPNEEPGPEEWQRR